MPLKTLIILFTRFPVSGVVKTRLIPCLGPDGAADFQRRMTEFAVQQARLTGMPVQVRYTGGTESQMREWLGAHVEYVHQGQGNLGERMERAFSEAFAAGAGKVVLMGSDCPDNRVRNVLHAFSLLERFPCVIGPALDGGYYLIGLRSLRPELFRDIDWGSDRVLCQTLQKTDSCRLLPTLSDVDEPQDVPPRISVIIPALNEEDAMGNCLRTVRFGFNVETIVVDGGSRDGTRRIAEQEDATGFASEKGRARQMNRGAASASGAILLFLHADSELPPEWDRSVREVMKQPQTALGYFSFAIKDRFRGKRWVELGVNMRSRLLSRPYGDQGLFLSRDTFNKLGGYPEIPILEDLFLVKQARKLGRIRSTKASLLTSGRRWMKYGVCRTTLINQAILVVAAWGGDLDKLREAYGAGKNPFRVLFGKSKASKRQKSRKG